MQVPGSLPGSFPVGSQTFTALPVSFPVGISTHQVRVSLEHRGKMWQAMHPRPETPGRRLYSTSRGWLFLAGLKLA